MQGIKTRARRERRRSRALLAAAAVGVSALYAGYVHGRSLWVPLLQRVSGQRSVADVVREVGPAARARLAPHFARAAVRYPPSKVVLLAFKKERRIELWAASGTQRRFLREYAVTAASGTTGPKRREGDQQVPEGLYNVTWLHPNSSYHLSMKLNYPNATDRRHARAEGRTRLGGDIFIHGKAVSIGCLAVGDEAIEELFVLAADSGRNVDVVIAPADLRRGPLPEADLPADVPWARELYQQIENKLAAFRRPVS